MRLWNPLRRSPAKSPPRIPEGIRLYAVGDIHGRADLLQELNERIVAHARSKLSGQITIVFVGDYIDRGPNSRQVVDEILSLPRTWESVHLRGNHENYLLQFLENPELLEEWIQFGGFYTLRSYGLSVGSRLLAAEQKAIADALREALMVAGHMDFFMNLRTSYTSGDFFFTHAGVRPGIPLGEQSETDLLGIRNEFLLSQNDFGKVVVHGHTPVSEPDVRFNRINIDTGAYATGRLTCLAIEGEFITFI